ncbi:hypothetical protein EHJ07_14805 [Cronobacter muytjensii]|nr:hypothetical protein [Cronobacter muytjensii]
MWRKLWKWRAPAWLASPAAKKLCVNRIAFLLCIRPAFLPGFFLQQARQARAKAVAQGTILRLDVKDFNL